MKFLFVISIPCFVGSFLLNAAEPLPLSQSYWKDGAFLKSFNGSYRINARIEPSVSTAERGLLVSVQQLMATGERAEALKKLQASKLSKSSAAILFNAGNIQFELGKIEEAAESYQKALKIAPNFRRAHRNLGFVYTRQDEWAKAIASLTHAIQLGDQDGATYGQLAYGYMHNEQYASALQAFRLAQITQPDHIDWKAGVASCLQQLERGEEALALLDEVIQARPTEASYYILQAAVLVSLGHNDDAITNLDFVRRLGGLDAENHLLLGNLHLRAGSLSLARPVLMKALTITPKPAPAAALNALEFISQMEAWELARDYVAALSRAYPDRLSEVLDRKKMRLTALINIKSGDDPRAGAAMLEKLIKLDPLDANSLLLLGGYRVTGKRYQEAEMLFQQAQRIEGHDYNASIELAKLHVTNTRYTDALKQLDRALEIRSTDAILEYREAVFHLQKASR